MQTAEPIIEVFILEDDLKDECKCESEHAISQCTVTVTHLTYSSCGVYRRRMVCQGSVKFAQAHMNDPRGVCAGCYDMARDCWNVIPI